jgi:hypothetical protein
VFYVRFSYHDVSLVLHILYVAVEMDHAWVNAMMVIKEIFAIMNRGGRSQGKVHYARIEVFTVFMSIIVWLFH